MKSQKGSSFERKICRDLSLWWSDKKRDDLFWRSAGSGAMAKTRSKTGKQTFGQYGDVQATDPEGQPLLDLVTIELKRGYSRNTIQDLIDNSVTKQQYEKFLDQVNEDVKNSGSYEYFLIVKRDRREILVFMPITLGMNILELLLKKDKNRHDKLLEKHMTIVHNKYKLFCITFNQFLLYLQKEDIIELLKHYYNHGGEM